MTILNRKSSAMRAAIASLTLLFTALPGLAHEGPYDSDAHVGRVLGDIDFPTATASAEAQAAFEQGMLLLHLFEYPFAEAQFQRAQALDPGFAMAYWGEAMCHNHPIWDEQDAARGRAVLEKFAPSHEARLARLATQKERDWFESLELLFGTADDGLTKAERDRAYLRHYARMAERYPDDHEVQLFHALALMGAHGGVRDIPDYMESAAVSQRVFYANRRHPGAAHYLIHAVDDPIHAPLGLEAARALYALAPDAGHSLHMTSHIFNALGMWDDVVVANTNAARVWNEMAAERGQAPRHVGHYNFWLLYGLLQAGRVQEARTLLTAAYEETTAIGQPPAGRMILDPDRDRVGSMVQMWARFMFETGGADADVAAWEFQTADAFDPNLTLHYVRGLLAADPAVIEIHLAAFDALHEALALEVAAMAETPPSFLEYLDRLEVIEHQLRSALARARGDHAGALEHARTASRLEGEMPFAYGPPFVDYPSAQWLGELALEFGRHEEAAAAFAEELRRARRKRQAVAGLEQAQALMQSPVPVATSTGSATPTASATVRPTTEAAGQAADLLITNGRVYTLSWPDPAPDGTLDARAPRDAQGWHPDAEALAIRGDRIVYVGSNAGALALRGEATEVVDVGGATVLPGLVDSHTHVFNLGASLTRVSLFGVETEEEAVARIVERAREVPPGEWIVGHGWDEGAWANRYPDMTLLTARVPDHPVYMRSLHSFAGWGNRLAFERAGITRDTEAPAGGEIGRFDDGEPNGLLLNRAVPLLEDAIPAPTPAQMAEQVTLALEQMSRDGYVAVHDAGLGAQEMAVLEALEAQDRLPIRVYAMLSARDEPLARRWLERGPDADADSFLVTRSVKAFYDGALGSRGARLLADYADQPGHRGVSGSQYGFDQALVAQMMGAGFQVAIHAIGDAGNRETLDFIERVLEAEPRARAGRHRIEHAQVIHPDDFPRFAALGVTASMEPPHAVEDKAWAELRLGPQRIRGAYAWRTLREAGARLTFNADNPGSDHDIFYGLHAAVTRRDREREPADGWYPEQSLNVDEALRAYTRWSAWASFREDVSGILEPGRWADVTVMDIDPFVLADTDAGAILDGAIVLTIVDGRIVHRARSD